MIYMANRIKELRKKQGLTLAEVAKIVGVSESTMQRYESEKISKIKYETMESLANLFGVDPPYLMGWSDESFSYAQHFENICKNIEQSDEKFRQIILDYYEMSVEAKKQFYEFWDFFKKMKT